MTPTHKLNGFDMYCFEAQRTDE